MLSNFPIPAQDTVFNLVSQHDVFYNKDFIMYKLEYTYGQSINDTLSTHETRNHYFVYYKDSAFGRDYYPWHDHPMWDGNRFRVDSVLKHIRMQGDYKEIAAKKPDSVYTDKDGIFIKVYNLPASDTGNCPENFSIYFCYANTLKDCKETFSKEMDNVAGKKLFKIRIAGHGAYYKVCNTTMPPREYVYEMSEMPVENAAEVISYFNKYKNEPNR